MDVEVEDWGRELKDEEGALGRGGGAAVAIVVGLGGGGTVMSCRWRDGEGVWMEEFRARAAEKMALRNFQFGSINNSYQNTLTRLVVIYQSWLYRATRSGLHCDVCEEGRRQA